MVEIKKLRLTTDFSDTSMMAFGHARVLAENFAAKIVLAYIDEDRVPPFTVEYAGAQVQDIIEAHRKQAEESLDKGYGEYPPLLWELTLVHLYSGREEQALLVWQDAVELGWRHYYLHGKGHYPLQDFYADDDRFVQTMRKVEADLERIRQVVRANGWAETPDEFFARDQLIISGAK